MTLAAAGGALSNARSSMGGYAQVEIRSILTRAGKSVAMALTWGVSSAKMAIQIQEMDATRGASLRTDFTPMAVKYAGMDSTWVGINAMTGISWQVTDVILCARLSLAGHVVAEIKPDQIFAMKSVGTGDPFIPL